MAGEKRPGRRILNLSRRELVVGGLVGVVGGGTGLLLGAYAGIRRERWKKRVPPRTQPFAPNVYLAVDEAGLSTVWIVKSEMGQGVRTALAMLVAEELEADWAAVRVEQPLANRNYGSQSTAASESVRGLFLELRQAGAAAREMLIAAAAQVWGVEPASCRAEAGWVIHAPTGRRLSYGALARRAATLPVPSAPSLKDPAQFRLLGTRVPRVDIPEKVDGSAVFGLDVRVPGMLHAVVARPPRAGATLGRMDAAAARAVPGVRDVFEIGRGVAIVAESTWAAMEGRARLGAEWTTGGPGLSSEALAGMLREALESRGGIARAAGAPGSILAAAGARRLTAEYEVPYLAHAPMEPVNCTASVTGGQCVIWAPTQNPQGVQDEAAKRLGIDPAAVVVHTTLLGGGFGRRTVMDEIAEVVDIARRVPAPVQVVWSREDDLRHDHFRPPALHRIEATLDAAGFPEAWRQVIASPTIAGMDSGKGEVDPLAVGGAADLPYRVPHLEVRWVGVPSPVPVGIWRSVSHSHTAFAVECFLDELAARAGQDPLAYRRALLGGSPRLRGVLELAAARAGWGTPLPPGRHRGLAVHGCFGSFAAQVAEVSVPAPGAVRVHRVVCAVDCGIVVNPDIVEAQIEGGIAFGLSAALHGAITLADGAVVESNFHDHRLLTIAEMPEVEVHLVRSAEPPGGIGELAVPLVAPAVANALRAARPAPPRRLPLVGRA